MKCSTITKWYRMVYNNKYKFLSKVVYTVAIQKEELYRLFEHLSQEDKKTAFDFMQFLIERSKKERLKSWEEIDQSENDIEPLTKEEIEQLNSDEGYISGEEAKREYGLQVEQNLGHAFPFQTMFGGG